MQSGGRNNRGGKSPLGAAGGPLAPGGGSRRSFGRRRCECPGFSVRRCLCWPRKKPFLSKMPREPCCCRNDQMAPLIPYWTRNLKGKKSGGESECQDWQRNPRSTDGREGVWKSLWGVSGRPPSSASSWGASMPLRAPRCLKKESERKDQSGRPFPLPLHTVVGPGRVQPNKPKGPLPGE